MGSYLRPRELGDALEALSAGPRLVLAGGTDYYPARVGLPLDDDVLDITDLGALKGIRDEGDHWRMPALVTWSELLEAKLPPLFDGLKQAAREVGGVQIQNTGTICGNLCNASPAADGIPNLLALDATVELASRRGTRFLPVADFVRGNRKTARAADEMMTAILVAKPTRAARSVFLKLGARRYMVISIVMVGAVIETEPDGTIAAARIAVGACSPVARRLSELERALVGKRLTPKLATIVASAHLSPLSPIDDVRGTAVYRRDATLSVLRRAISALAGGGA
jgi:CO/xanthine dehydrogenase FAD-binding subunit